MLQGEQATQLFLSLDRKASHLICPSPATPDMLSETFVKVDRNLEYGFSRQLIINTLKAMGCMTKEEETEYHKSSNYFQPRSKRLFSMTLKNFLEKMEEIA